MRRWFFTYLIFIASVFASNPAFAFSDCTKAEFATTVVEDVNFICDKMRELSFEALNRSVKIRSIRDLGNNRADQYEPVVIQAIEQSLAVFGNYAGYADLKISDVTVIIMDPATDVIDAFADTRSLTSTECTIRIDTTLHDLRTSGQNVILELQNSVAHELFHCVQFATWPQQMALSDSKWWYEGTAELMGHVVFENPDGFKARATDFANKSQNTPITQMDYGNAVFFSWLWAKSKSSFFELITAMPTTAGELRQRDVLANIVGLAWLADFARDYADGKVQTPNGAPIAAPVPLPAELVTDTKDSTYAVEPFTVFIADIEYASGQYLISTEGKPDVSYKSLKDLAGPWQPPLYISAEGPCADRKGFRFAGMSVSAGDADTYTIKAQKLPGCEGCDVTEVRDQCLIGTWRLNNMSLSAEMFAQQPDALDQIIATGLTAVSFEKSGQSHFGFKNVMILGKPSNVNGSIVFGVQIEGVINSEWSTENGHLKTCYKSSDAGIVLRLPGVEPGNVIKFSDIPRTEQMNYTYQCNGTNEAFMTMDLDNKKFTFRLDRIQ